MAEPLPYPKATMVRWFAPLQLLQTGRMVWMSAIMGEEFDRRQMDPRAYDDYPVFDFSDRDELVFDYVADTGDGWNSTYAVALAATRPVLELRDPTGAVHQTRRGDIFVFGGDEIYPTPSRSEYRQRLVMPYKAAMAETADNHPTLFAIPGNHDWYDNLASFTRLFLEKPWFAGWQLGQRRSYFAARLPHDWWLIGVDTQLGADLDATQVAYFKGVAAMLGPTAKVILCTAEPHWVFEHEAEAKRQSEVRRETNLEFLEHHLFKDRVRVNLSGDYHHYRRHGSPDNRTQKIIAGGGGAFLHPTHNFKQTPLPSGHELRCSYPDIATSRRMAWRNFAFVGYSPTFGALSGFLYLIVGWNILGGLQDFHQSGFGTTLLEVLTSILATPSAFTSVLLVLVGFVIFTDTHRRPYRILAGLTHAWAHLGAILALGYFASQAAQALEWGFAGLAHISLTLVLLFVGGWILGAEIMGTYLLISLNVFHRHCTEGFSGLAIQDYKNFMRLAIAKDGSLTIYPVGIDRVPRKWREQDVPATEPRFVADDTDPRYTPRLIEPPIHVPAN